ncbi:MAG: hypothetical protein KAI55_02415 [Candidatus Aenigmarchaeota archaeon]|nr:hypothetical protein [Candidatus Aenigmarchaeota archaeon]
MNNTEKRSAKIILFLVLVLFVISLITLLHFINPEELVNEIGIQNGYILVAVVSFFGGFSAGGSISFISLLIALVAGGMNPIYLGIVAGVSLAIGDIIIFYIGSKGIKLIRGKWDKRIDKIANVYKKRKWLEKIVFVIAYIYIGFLPLPNDIIILFLAAVKYPPKKMNVIIILGDFTFALMITLLATKGIMPFI